MKKFAIVIISILLVVGLVACGDKGDSDQVSKPSETSKTSEASEANEANEAGKSDDSATEKNPYNLDYESTEIQDMSADKKASVETLRETAMDWLEGRTMFVGTKFADYTYEDVAKHIGVDATIYYYNELWPGRTYSWYAEDDDNVSFAIVLKERGGVWKLDAATQSAFDSETGKANEADKAGDSAAEKNPYNLDYESTEFQNMSVDKKASVETLRETAMDWLEGRTMFVGTKFADYTYEDVAEHIGVDATIYYYDDQAHGRKYIWEGEDDIASWFFIILKERGGVWKLTEGMSYFHE
jgi:NOL1/NOP2/fmu family ribosome biogenesis protein